MIQTAPISKNKMTYDEAILYCRFCTYKGYTDWRLPTWAEYKSLNCWYIDRSARWSVNAEDYLWWVSPVRDI
jgi:hypothetical protein